VSASPAAAVPLREGRLVHEGHGYHWELWGAGARETVCLFNGLAMSTKSWLSFLPELVGDRDVLLYDYLGQGASDDAAVPGAPISVFGDALAENAVSFAAIPCPVLVLAGAEDRAIPTSQQRKIPSVIPHAVYEEIAGAGHVVYLEKPEVFWPRLRRFLGGERA